ncbi:hypothetical protein [Aeromicrobium sp.]|uniref:hypothetical protein n=1 Tax=Aeromicrobium sp. TaxID=1871063 RepID=UPI0030C4242E
MRSTLAKSIAVAAMVAGSIAFSSGGASAAHCVEGDTPGFSYFGTVHVAGPAHDSEGKGKHMGTAGASNCRDTTGSPSERAPGKG